MHFRWWRASLLLATILTACPSGPDGSITGTVSPPGQDVRISAVRQATLIASVASDSDGRFVVSVPPGTYDIRVASSASPYPLVFPAVSVRSREATDLGSIELALPTGNAVIRGRVFAATPDTSISLLAEGIERSAVHARADGSYLFEHLAPAEYLIQIRTPGYADDTLKVTVRDGQTVKQDIRQLYITSIEGADWARGILRSRGVGLPPPQAPTPTVRREMAKRAALADAERNLLRMMELLQVGPEQKLADLLGERTAVNRLQGYLRGYRVSADRDLDGGRVEIELELSLTGPDGISSYLHAL